jgi:hypothetical protein
MALDHPLHDGVVDPNAWKVLRAVQLLEYTKQLVIVRHVETRAIIGAMVHLFVTLNVAAHLDRMIRRLAAEFEDVGKKINLHLVQQRTVAACRRYGFDCLGVGQARVCSVIQLGGRCARERFHGDFG